MKYYCRESIIQEYDCCVFIVPRWKSSHKYICFDKCLANELFYLWDKGIITTGCCCGQHKNDVPGSDYIGVQECFIPTMKKLGYKTRINPTDPKREDSFIPKTKFPERK